MGKKLLVVESPTKVKTIKKYVGSDFIVKATLGHVKDLPKNKMGVDIENGFIPTYTIIRGRQKILKELKELSEKSEIVYLAPDPDREGEAIAWHVAQELGLDNHKIKRVLFNEITPKGIREGLAHPVDIDQNRVNSQIARRILDRLVGYEISPVLWKKIKRGLSAGRVQSVALRLVVEREEEIESFVPEEYWIIKTIFTTEDGNELLATLIKIDGKKVKITTQEEAKKIEEELKNSRFDVEKVEKKIKKQFPQPPFITSRLQQEASAKFKFSAQKTMQIAQSLYEGVEIGDEGPIGLITYMRTDSTRISDTALWEVRKYIKEVYGEQYLPPHPNIFKAKKGIQDAHEAIRPTSMKYSPQYVKPYLTQDQYKLYKLIWDRFISSQMPPAEYEQNIVDIKGGRFLLRAESSILKFEGWMLAYKIEEELKEDKEGVTPLPKVSEGEVLNLKKVDLEQKFTQPPQRYTEGTLVRELEEKGIGRPSTYATIVSTIQERGYVVKEKGKLVPTPLGRMVTKKLIEYFPDIMDVKFTALMEENLDKIEEGKLHWQDLLKTFYPEFHKEVEEAIKFMKIEKQKPILTDKKCPECGGDLVIRTGRNGNFLACLNFPKCKFTKNVIIDKDGNIVEETETATITEQHCPNCGSFMVVRQGKFGKFLACKNYPKCKVTMPLKTGLKCPRPGCNGELIERRSKKGKTYYICENLPNKECDFILYYRPVKERCPKCGVEFIAMTNKKNNSYRCVVCGWYGKLEKEITHNEIHDGIKEEEV